MKHCAFQQCAAHEIPSGFNKEGDLGTARDREGPYYGPFPILLHIPLVNLFGFCRDSFLGIGCIESKKRSAATKEAATRSAAFKMDIGKTPAAILSGWEFTFTPYLWAPRKRRALAGLRLVAPMTLSVRLSLS